MIRKKIDTILMMLSIPIKNTSVKNLRNELVRCIRKQLQIKNHYHGVRVFVLLSASL